MGQRESRPGEPLQREGLNIFNFMAYTYTYGTALGRDPLWTSVGGCDSWFIRVVVFASAFHPMVFAVEIQLSMEDKGNMAGKQSCPA